MTDMSDIDPIVTDVILEEEEVSILPSDSEFDGISLSASQVGPADVMPRAASASSSKQRPSSALTVENLRLHEQNVAQEVKSLSRHGSASSSHLASRAALSPVRTPGSGTPVRLCSGKSGLGHVTDGTTPTTDTIRTGSGKREPLPPIGVDPTNGHQSGNDLNRLTVSRETVEDGETILSASRMSARSERSVTFRNEAERSQSSTSVVDKRKRTTNSSIAGREVHKATGADGTEKVTISTSTETEWSWLEMIKVLGKTEEELAAMSATLRPRTPTEPRLKSALLNGRGAEEVEMLEAREGSKVVDGGREGAGPDHEEENKMDNVPPLELDSDSDFSDDEMEKLQSDQGVPKIGPPQIIKYQRESEQVPISQKYRDAANVVGKQLDIDFDELNSDMLSEKEDVELEARIKGRRKVSRTPYGDEYDYDDMDLQEDDEPHHKSIFTAKASKSKSDSYLSVDTGGTPPLSTVGEEGETCEYCGKEVKPFPTLEMQKSMSTEELYCCKEYQDLVEYTIENTPLSQHPSDELIDIAPHAPYGSKQARRAAKERAAQRMREREMARQRAAGSNQANFYASHRIEIMDGVNSQLEDEEEDLHPPRLRVARQMKTINYSLASQKCLDEGWTVRPPSPEDEDKNKKPVFIPEPTTPQLPAILKSKKRNMKETPIVRKEYRSGQIFMVMFENGTGAVFYPSGALAILISSVEKNQFHYHVQADGKPDEAKLLAMFEPNGSGTCYHGNGNIRLNINQFGGLFTDQTGSIKKRWSWKDGDLKTPPFQPLCFSLNAQLSIRCMTQDQIFINFNCELQTCRFNAGAKLKLVAPDQMPPKEIDRDMLYMSEVKTYVQMVMDQIFNQKNFGKSPKLDNLRPTLKIQNTVRKNERLKQKVVERKIAKKAGPVVVVK